MFNWSEGDYCWYQNSRYIIESVDLEYANCRLVSTSGELLSYRHRIALHYLKRWKKV